jgi:hypothetical protein
MKTQLIELWSFFSTSLIEKEQSKLNVQFIGMLILIIINRAGH